MNSEILRCGAWFIWRNHQEFQKGTYSIDDLKTDSCVMTWNMFEASNFNADIFRSAQASGYEVLCQFKSAYPNQMNIWDEVLLYIDSDKYNPSIDDFIMKYKMKNPSYIDPQIAEKFYLATYCFKILKEKFEDDDMTISFDITNNLLSAGYAIVGAYITEIKGMQKPPTPPPFVPPPITSPVTSPVTSPRTQMIVEKTRSRKNSAVKCLRKLTQFSKNKKIKISTSESDVVSNFESDSVYVEETKSKIDNEVIIAHFVEECWAHLEQGYDIVDFIRSYRPPTSNLVDLPYLRVSYLKSVVPYKLLQSQYLSNFIYQLGSEVNDIVEKSEKFLRVKCNTADYNEKEYVVSSQDYLTAMRLALLTHALDKTYARVAMLSSKLTLTLQSINDNNQVQDLLVCLASFSQAYENNRLELLADAQPEKWIAQEQARKRFTSTTVHGYDSRNKYTGRRNIPKTAAQLNLLEEISGKFGPTDDDLSKSQHEENTWNAVQITTEMSAQRILSSKRSFYLPQNRGGFIA